MKTDEYPLSTTVTTNAKNPQIPMIIGHSIFMIILFDIDHMCLSCVVALAISFYLALRASPGLPSPPSTI